jgi:ubiquinone/menaquinone biosynthesis C-methylase UbiE
MNPMAHVPAAYLRQAARTPAIRAIKQRAYALLGLLPGTAVLDIGCGPGISTPDLARIVGPFGRVTGIDHDAAMVREADEAARLAGVSAWTRHLQGDAVQLAFPSASFNACFSDRMLQHLTETKAAACVAEAARVTRPGGAVVFVDSDWGSFSLDMADAVLERHVQALHQARFHNPYAGRALGRLLRRAGLAYVGVEPVAIPLVAPQVVNLLTPTIRDARRAGALDDASVARWNDAVSAWFGVAHPVGHLTIAIAAGSRM